MEDDIKQCESKPATPKISGATYKAIIFDERISHGAFRLWHVLRDYAGNKMICWPGQRKLKRDLGSNFEAIAGWRDELVRSGWLRFKTGRRNCHIYELVALPTAPESGSAPESGCAAHPKSGAVTAPESGCTTKPSKLNPRTEAQSSPAQLVVWDRELTDVQQGITNIEKSYDEHMNKSPNDRKRLHELKARRTELKRLLGRKF